ERPQWSGGSHDPLRRSLRRLPVAVVPLGHLCRGRRDLHRRRDRRRRHVLGM
ncbi:MAG: hypothetical protein AVDCRST_MAG85-582, partial [uncultured Solirubrobacteraceae bacterium]